MIVASTEFYRAKVAALGIEFRPMRPNWDPTGSEPIRQCEALKTGPEVLFRKLILPHLRDTYDDLLSAAADTDLMIAGELVYAAPLVAEKIGLPWASAILSPCSFFSAYDPSVLANMPGLTRLRRAGWLVNRAALDLGRIATRHWWRPVRYLRREEGLRSDCDPLIRDKFSRIGRRKHSSPALSTMTVKRQALTRVQNWRLFFHRRSPRLCSHSGPPPCIILATFIRRA